MKIVCFYSVQLISTTLNDVYFLVDFQQSKHRYIVERSLNLYTKTWVLQKFDVRNVLLVLVSTNNKRH